MKNSNIFIPGLIVLLFLTLTIFNSCEEEAGLTQEDLLKLELDYQKQKDSLAYLKYVDSLNYQRYLDSLNRMDQAAKDSIALYAGKGNVTYSVLIADGGIASGDESQRTAENARFAGGVTVTVSMFGIEFTKTTDVTGLAVFENMVKGEVLGHAFVADFTPVSWAADITPCEECGHYYDTNSARSAADTTQSEFAGFFNIANIIYIFPTTGANTSIIQGLVTIESDLTNETRELAPAGTEITATIDVGNNIFDNRFIEDATPGTNTGDISHIAYEGSIAEATVQADGTFSFEVPAAAMGLPLRLNFADIALDQLIFDDVNQADVTSETYRTIFSASYAVVSAIPAAGAPVIGFDAGGGATATALVGSGAVTSIEITNGGLNFNGDPMVTITAPNIDPNIGTTATATATVTSGVVTSITITDPGAGYTAAPTVAITEGSGAAIAFAAYDQTTTNGNVQSISLTTGGTNYADPPFVVIPAPPAGGTQATATTTLNSTGSVQQINVTNSGGGYAAQPGILISSGQNAVAAARVEGAAGIGIATAVADTTGLPGVATVSSIAVVFAGSDHYNVPIVVITGGGATTDATATATIDGNGLVTAITVTSAGAGYTGIPTVIIQRTTPGEIVRIDVTDGGEYYSTTPTISINDTGAGSGATAIAAITADNVTSITLTNSGNDSYSVAGTSVTITPVGSGATATAVWTGLGISSVNITAAGQDYVNTPVLVFSDPEYTGPGSQVAQGTAIVTGNQITGVNITDPGLGYTGTGGAPTIAVVAGSLATADALIAGSSIVAMNITASGAGYLAAPNILIEDGGGSGATATCTITNGHVTSITITNAGAGYTGAPTVTFLDPTGATAEAVVTDGVITAITLLKGGENYLAAPNVTITGAIGHSATATATVAGGAVTSVTVVSGGTGYIQGNTPAAGEIFSITPGPDQGDAHDVESNLTLIRDIHYGTGQRQAKAQ